MPTEHTLPEAWWKGLWRALHNTAGAAARWRERFASTPTDEQLREAISAEFGIQAGASGNEGYACAGGEHPRVWFDGRFRGKPDLQGPRLLNAARALLVVVYGEQE